MSARSNQPHTYAAIASAIERSRTRRPQIANNTWAEFATDKYEQVCIDITLHRTRIVRLYPCGACILNTGGWNTVTTRKRMNRYLPAGVRAYSYSRKHRGSPACFNGPGLYIFSDIDERSYDETEIVAPDGHLHHAFDSLFPAKAAVWGMAR